MSAYGECSVSPSSLKVNQNAKWQLKYVVGRNGIAVGGRIKIQMLGRGFCEDFQITDPEKKGFVRVTSSNNSARVRLLPSMLKNGTMLKQVGCQVEKAPLKEGDEVIFTFGDTSNGSAGFTVPKYSQEIQIQLLIDCTGDRDFLRLPDPPSLSYKAEDPVRFVVICPSQTPIGQPARVGIKPVDQYNNVAPFYTGNIKLTICSMNSTPVKTIQLEKKGKGVLVTEITFPAPGMYFLRVKDNTNNLEGSSNPVLVYKGSLSLNYYWGDIHGHTLMSDGHLTPHQFYTYARDVELLDFSAITDHDTHMSRRERGGEDEYLFSPFWHTPLGPWNIIKYETARFHHPGRFVTLLGYEWTGSTVFTPRDMCFGHKNVYYLSDDGPMYSHLDPESNTPHKLYHLLKNKEAIVIPHHTIRQVSPSEEAYTNNEGQKPESQFVPSRGGTNWDFHDEKLECLVEIYSKWGNSEYFGCPRPVVNSKPEGSVQEALRRGYKMGFVAGSDTHTSGPGSPFPEWQPGPLKYRSGLTCVLAPKLTRQAIFEALKRRHCYATTGERIYLEFTLNDKFIMGDCVSFPHEKSTRKFQIVVGGTDIIDKIQIIKNNEEIHTENPESNFLRFTFEDSQPIQNIDYYYIRVTQKDGEMAWFSPIWVRTYTEQKDRA